MKNVIVNWNHDGDPLWAQLTGTPEEIVEQLWSHAVFDEDDERSWASFSVQFPNFYAIDVTNSLSAEAVHPDDLSTLTGLEPGGY